MRHPRLRFTVGPAREAIVCSFCTFAICSLVAPGYYRREFQDPVVPLAFCGEPTERQTFRVLTPHNVLKGGTLINNLPTNSRFPMLWNRRLANLLNQTYPID